MDGGRSGRPARPKSDRMKLTHYPRKLRVDRALRLGYSLRLSQTASQIPSSPGHEDIFAEERGHHASLVRRGRHRAAARSAGEPCRAGAAGQAQADVHAALERRWLRGRRERREGEAHRTEAGAEALLRYT